MILNWNAFGVKYSNYEQKAFENLSYELFCLEKGNTIEIFRYFNQTGIETMPIGNCGFQAKYYTTPISKNKIDIIDSINKTKSKHPNINTINFYINREFSESPDKGSIKPKYQVEIESFAIELNIVIEWRVPSNFEIPLSQFTNRHIHNRYFELVDSLESLQIRNYPEIENYIPRKVRNYNSWNILAMTDHEKYTSAPLLSFIEKGMKSIILYSDAQMGKSTEANYLAYKLGGLEQINPYIFPLNKYSTKLTLEEKIGISKIFSNYRLGVLILDGLDEIADEHRHEAIKEICSIKENHPELYIIVTCRENFECSNKIEGFAKLYLNSLSWDDVKSFAKQNMENSEVQKFIAEIKSKEYYEFIDSPFLLIETIDYFKEKSSLPANKATIYDRCIDKSIKAYKEKSAKGDARAISKMKPILKCIAFCMVLSQKQEITLDELCDQLKIDEQLAKQLPYISLIHAKEDNGDMKISFVHNSFKEHLAAKTLSDKSIDEIKNIICYNNTELIKPIMYNTLVSLLGVISNNQQQDHELINWLSCDLTRNKILIEFGGEMANKEQKTTIFKSVYTEYKEKGLWCDWSNKLHSDKMLMRFCNTKESIDFLFSELESEPTLNINKINALRLLRYANFSLYQGEKGNKIDYLLSICSEEDLNSEHGEYLVYVFKNRYIFEGDLISRVFEKAKNSTNIRVRNHLCRMITKSELCDEYIEWIFEDYFKNGSYTTLINIENNELKDYFRGLKEPKNIIRSINYASRHIDKSRPWRNENH